MEISKLKAEIISLTNKSNDNSNSNSANKNEVITDNEEFNELKNKNKQLEEENIVLRAQLEKNKNEGDGEGKDDNNIELQNLKQKYSALVTKLKEAQENIKKANSVLRKANKYNVCVSLVSQLLKEMKPSSDKETYLYNKLKGIVEKEEKEKSEEKKK